jgi:predicted negative regulator of RcsB-dependent stress response
MTPNDEHTERLLYFWQSYRFYVATGLAMLLALIAGFTYRHNQQTEEKTRVNGELFALLQAAKDSNLPEAKAQYEALLQNGEFPELPLLGGFALVSLQVEEDNAEDAAKMLRAVLDNTGDEGYARLAALRLAELRIDENKPEEALELLKEHAPAFGRLRILFNERIGDAEYINKNYREAEEAYLDALQIASQSAPFYVPLVRIKVGALLSDGNARRPRGEKAEAEEPADAGAQEANSDANENANANTTDSAGDNANSQ